MLQTPECIGELEIRVGLVPGTCVKWKRTLGIITFKMKVNLYKYGFVNVENDGTIELVVQYKKNQNVSPLISIFQCVTLKLYLYKRLYIRGQSVE